MEKEFVPYDLALKLKKLGFNEPCFGWYDLKEEDYIPEVRYDFETKEDFDILAPLWQQAFDFFISKGYYSEIYPDNSQFIEKSVKWFFIIKKGTITTNSITLFTREEAREACINELINLNTEYEYISS